MRRGSGGLLALVLLLPSGPGGVTGGERHLPRGDIRGGVLGVSWWQKILREAEWQTIFATLWSLWTHRKEVIFKGRTLFVDAI